jgi:hypothetical protein
MTQRRRKIDGSADSVKTLFATPGRESSESGMEILLESDLHAIQGIDLQAFRGYTTT